MNQRAVTAPSGASRRDLGAPLRRREAERMDDRDGPLPLAGTRNPTADGSLNLFLALYLLVLAFFILLVSISTHEPVRSRAVIESVGASFAAAPPDPTPEPDGVAAAPEEMVAAQRFQTETAGLFAAALQVARVEIVQPGRLMRVRMPADTLFFADEARLRPAHFELFDRIVASLAARPPGLKFDLEFVIDAPYGDDGLLPASESLPLARGWTFVRDLAARGAPPDALSMGLRPSAANEAIMWFFVRFPDEETRRFGLLRDAPG